MLRVTLLVRSIRGLVGMLLLLPAFAGRRPTSVRSPAA